MIFSPLLARNMSDTTEKIAFFRASLAKEEPAQTQARVPLGHRLVDLCLNGGLVRGVLHEVLAAPGHETAAAGFAAALASRLGGGKHLLWIRQDFSALEHGELCATGLLELGLDPSRLLLLRVADMSGVLRAASDALSCAALGSVVIEFPGNPKLLDLVAQRRLMLGAAEKGVSAILLRFGAKQDAGAAETRWLVRAACSPAQEENWGRPVFDAQLLRNRHGQTGHWVMEWSCDDGQFAADCGAVVSSSGDRPAAAAMESLRCVA